MANRFEAAHSTLAASGADGFIGEGDALHNYHLFDVTVDEGDTEIEPDAVGDELGWEAVAVEGSSWLIVLPCRKLAPSRHPR